MGRLERVLDLLTTRDVPEQAERLTTFGEFEQLYRRVVADGPEEDRKTLAVAANAFLGFRPETRPVYWRILIVQARLYQALIRTKGEPFHVPRPTPTGKRCYVLIVKRSSASGGNDRRSRAHRDARHEHDVPDPGSGSPLAPPRLRGSRLSRRLRASESAKFGSCAARTTRIVGPPTGPAVGGIRPLMQWTKLSSRIRAPTTASLAIAMRDLR